MEPQVAIRLKRKVEKMKKSIPFVAVLFMGWALATTALADELCKLPPGIETGERYVIMFRGDSKQRRSKILAVENCWVQTFRTSGDHRWFPIKNILYIGTKAVKKK